MRAHSERIGELLQVDAWLGILFGGHGYLLVHGGCSHHNQVEVTQLLVMGDTEKRGIDVAIDLLIVSGDSHKAVA